MTLEQAGEARKIDDRPGGRGGEPSVWALGDYHRFATATVWAVGPELVEACGIAPGQRVLDVAAGTGNVAIRAAEAGAEVVALDITPENFEAGRREADARGVEVRWVEGDAQALPFPDGSFDVVTSCFGAMFAPDHAAVAAELLRVCRKGGAIGLTSFRPEGTAAEFFDVVASLAPPPPPDALSPLLWGTEAHVAGLFGDLADLRTARREYVEHAESPEAYVELYTRSFGPLVALRAALEQEGPKAAAALDRRLLDFATRASRRPAGGPAELVYEYLLVVARRR